MKNNSYKNSIKSLTFILFVLVTKAIAMGYDFETDGIFYTKISNTEVEVRSGYYKNYEVSTVVIPNDVTWGGNDYTVSSIGDSAFYDCYKLSTIILPESIKSIGKYAFFGCNELTLMTSSYTVDDAIKIIKGGELSPEKWVHGYIVGAVAPEVVEVKSNSDIEWTATPILDNTLVIGHDPDTKDIEHCLIIELPQESFLWKYGNLVDNPDNYQKRIDVRGIFTSVMDTYGVDGCSGALDSWKIEGVVVRDGSIAAGNGTQKTPYNVSQVQGGAAFGTTTWVKGYIVGWVEGQVLVEGAKFNATNVTVASNILIANTADCKDVSLCIPVQLPFGAVRTGLNLMDNPGNLGKAVSLNGSIESYFGTKGVKTVTEYELEGGDTPTPPTPSGDFKGDFNSFNGGAPKASPYDTYTNATGWTAENAIILSGDDDPAKASNPYFGFIGKAGTLAPTLNGKAEALGRLVSPLLTGGIKTLTFSYGFAFTEAKCQFTVNIKDASGNVVKTDTVTLDTITKLTACTYSLDVNYTGDFTIEIVNNGYSGATANKDRLSIWNLTWTPNISSSNTSTRSYNTNWEVFERLDIPNSVTSIGEYAFAGCRKIEAITIPRSLNIIDSCAFFDCTGLRKVNIQDITNWCKMKFCDEKSNPIYFAKNLCVNNQEINELAIPNSITSINDYAFVNFANLTSLFIPGSVQNIGKCAFTGCSSLMSISIPNSVNSVGDNAFRGCSGLASVKIGDYVNNIGDYAFGDCTSLKAVKIGSSVNELGNNTFSRCMNLETVNILGSVKVLGDSVFYRCYH